MKRIFQLVLIAVGTIQLSYGQAKFISSTGKNIGFANDFEGNSLVDGVQTTSGNGTNLSQSAGELTITGASSQYNYFYEATFSESVDVTVKNALTIKFKCIGNTTDLRIFLIDENGNRSNQGDYNGDFEISQYWYAADAFTTWTKNNFLGTDNGCDLTKIKKIGIGNWNGNFNGTMVVDKIELGYLFDQINPAVLVARDGNAVVGVLNSFNSTITSDIDQIVSTSLNMSVSNGELVLTGTKNQYEDFVKVEFSSPININNGNDLIKLRFKTSKNGNFKVKYYDINGKSASDDGCYCSTWAFGTGVDTYKELNGHFDDYMFQSGFDKSKVKSFAISKPDDSFNETFTLDYYIIGKNPEAIEITPSYLTIPSTAGIYMLTINSTAIFTATNKSEWINISTQEFSPGISTLSYTVSGNSASSNTRTGFIDFNTSVLKKTLTLVQARSLPYATSVGANFIDYNGFNVGIQNDFNNTSTNDAVQNTTGNGSKAVASQDGSGVLTIAASSLDGYNNFYTTDFRSNPIDMSNFFNILIKIRADNFDQALRVTLTDFNGKETTDDFNSFLYGITPEFKTFNTDLYSAIPSDFDKSRIVKLSLGYWGFPTYTGNIFLDKLVIGGLAPALNAEKEATNLSASNGSTSVTVTSNLSWTAATDANWITIPANGNGNSVITLNYLQNTSVNARTASITFSGGDLTKTIELTQEGFSEVLSILASNDDVIAAGGTTNATITSNVSWTISSNDSWISASTLAGFGNKIIELSYLENTSLDPRTAKLTVIGQNLNTILSITQLGKTTGISQTSINELVSVYPNPSNGNFSIKTTENDNFSIVNYLGQVVFQTKGATEVKSLPKGLYQIVIQNKSLKIVVE